MRREVCGRTAHGRVERFVRFALVASCVSAMTVLPSPAAMPLPVPHPDVISRILPDGSVLFHPQTEVYFGLNETGTVIWQALAAGASCEEALIGAVRGRWPDAPATDVMCHVRELLADLSVEGLVVDTAVSLG